MPCLQTLAERKAAQFLDRKEKSKGKRIDKLPAFSAGGSPYAQALEEIGISDRDASRWRTVAEVPETTVSRATPEEIRKLCAGTKT